ncbi:autorepressor SdpR family transcription factor [Marinicellulosiphila megalodicopiae]|uniref:autorepressor SdpR family transcription factor n=1 Tax=Marinicellulosiphila megalodicopiae TaxID=2724896 RepID=UPI003BB202BE
MNQVYKALGDPTRREILRLLREHDLCAGDLASHFDLSKPALSKHFAILKKADLVTDYKKGNYNFYRLNVSVLEESLMQLMHVFNLGAKK